MIDFLGGHLLTGRSTVRRGRQRGPAAVRGLHQWLPAQTHPYSRHTSDTLPQGR